jgi:hypothetical protein
MYRDAAQERIDLSRINNPFHRHLWTGQVRVRRGAREAIATNYEGAWRAYARVILRPRNWTAGWELWVATIETRIVYSACRIYTTSHDFYYSLVQFLIGLASLPGVCHALRASQVQINHFYTNRYTFISCT